MQRDFEFSEIVTFNHRICIEADSEEKLDRIEDILNDLFDDDEVSEKEDLFRSIRQAGGKYEFIEDGSPTVEFE